MQSTAKNIHLGHLVIPPFKVHSAPPTTKERLSLRIDEPTSLETTITTATYILDSMQFSLSGEYCIRNSLSSTFLQAYSMLYHQYAFPGGEADCQVFLK